MRNPINEKLEDNAVKCVRHQVVTSGRKVPHIKRLVLSARVGTARSIHCAFIGEINSPIVSVRRFEMRVAVKSLYEFK